MWQFEISVDTCFVASKSDPAQNQYLFAYTITVANTGDEPAQLLNRHWIITNGDGEQREVRGPGVVGNQPRIAPGQAFRYASVCPLDTEVGVMQGSYEFRTDDGERFEVPIAPFSLQTPNAVH